jgi:hypothetical protein
MRVAIVAVGCRSGGFMAGMVAADPSTGGAVLDAVMHADHLGADQRDRNRDQQ